MPFVEEAVFSPTYVFGTFVEKSNGSSCEGLFLDLHFTYIALLISSFYPHLPSPSLLSSASSSERRNIQHLYVNYTVLRSEEMRR
jgi:hypothetical protein